MKYVVECDVAGQGRNRYGSYDFKALSPKLGAVSVESDLW